MKKHILGMILGAALFQGSIWGGAWILERMGSADWRLPPIGISMIVLMLLGIAILGSSLINLLYRDL
jgi:hypothetical protein